MTEYERHYIYGAAGGKSGIVGEGSPDASFGCFLREALQSQTHAENILYNKSPSPFWVIAEQKGNEVGRLLYHWPSLTWWN